MAITRRPTHPASRIVIASVAIFALGLGAWYLWLSRSCDRPDYWSTCVERLGNPTVTDAASPEGEVGAKNMIVEISGTHFGPGTKVWFGDQPAEIVKIYNSQRLRVKVPVVDVPQVVDISVARGNGPKSVLKDGYRHESEVEVESIAPTSGPPAGGTKVTIHGSGFAKGTAIDFGGMTSQTAEYIDQHTLRIITPPHEPGTVVVNLYVGEDNLLLDDAFTYE